MSDSRNVTIKLTVTGERYPDIFAKVSKIVEELDNPETVFVTDAQIESVSVAEARKSFASGGIITTTKTPYTVTN